MKEICLEDRGPAGISNDAIKSAVYHSLAGKIGKLKKVLIIPPDFTRMYSYAGKITEIYYCLLNKTCDVDIMPALGTHRPMTHAEIRAFFGENIPMEKIICHNWRNDVIKIGEVPKSYVEEISEGLIKNKIDVEVNRKLVDKTYDLIISIGQVVPHEVVGMANYSKNIFVGCGGSSMINQTHMLGAFYGMERIMGRDNSPVRKVLDYAENNFIQDIPLLYALTVTTQVGDAAVLHGLYIGRSRKLFEKAVGLSQEKNITYVDEPFKKVVVNLDEREFKSTWLGNKAIYRTRMAIEDGGELIILAPGVERFGEDGQNDALIRKYGYVGRKNILKLCEQNEDLRNNLSVAAHLIHGSSDGRFSITYAAGKISKEEIESVNFRFMSLSDAYKIYDPEKLRGGINVLDNNDKIFYISNPALGLWIYKNNKSGE